LISDQTDKILNQSHRDKFSSQVEENDRFSELDRENAALREEIGILKSQREQLLLSSRRSEDLSSNIADERSSFHAELRQCQGTIESLLKKDEDTTSQLLQANRQLAELREQIEFSDDGKSNKIYELNRALMVASDLNKEHASALGIAAKKLIRLEEGIKLYKHTVHDVAKTLGVAINRLVTDPVSQEDLEAMHASAMDATPDAPDAVFTLRISERICSTLTFLDQELQLALNDVAPPVRAHLRKIPAFDECLVRHCRSSASVHADTCRLMSSVEEACRNFELEFSTIQPDEL
jgi:hypothetical protein